MVFNLWTPGPESSLEHSLCTHYHLFPFPLGLFTFLQLWSFKNQKEIICISVMFVYIRRLCIFEWVYTLEWLFQANTRPSSPDLLDGGSSLQFSRTQLSVFKYSQHVGQLTSPSRTSSLVELMFSVILSIPVLLTAPEVRLLLLLLWVNSFRPTFNGCCLCTWLIWPWVMLSNFSLVF